MADGRITDPDLLRQLNTQAPVRSFGSSAAIMGGPVVASQANKPPAPAEMPGFRAAVVRAEVEAREAANAKAARAAKQKTAEEIQAIGLDTEASRRMIRRAISNVSPLSAGFGGAYTAGVPYSPAQSLVSDLETIKSKIGLNELLALKEKGGTLGQVAIFELQALQKSLGDLDAALPPDRLKANLREVEYRMANTYRAVAGQEPYKTKTDYYKDVSQQKKQGLKEIKQAGPSEVDIATGDTKTISDPAKRGLNSTVRAKIGAGQTADEIVSYLNKASPGLGDTIASQVEAAVKFREQFPDVSMSEYPIDIERVEVPASKVEQFLGKVAESPFGGYLSAAAESLTAGTLPQFTSSPELTRAAMRSIREESPAFASFVGDVTGASLAMLPAVRGLGAAGLGARAAGLGASTAYGGVYGGATGEGDLATDVAVGAGLGLLGGVTGEAVTRGAGRVLAPQVDKAVSLLAEKKIPMTAGQMLGGAFKAFEDKLQSVPFMGDIIKSGRGRGLQQAQRVVINEALEPLGKKLPKNVEVGTDAMKFMQESFDDAYGAVRSRMAVRRDNALVKGLTDIVGSARSGGELTDAQAQQLQKIVNSKVLSRFDKNTRQMDGDVYKLASSDLKKLARENYGTPLGARINDVRVALDDAASRFSPKDAVDELKAIDTGYAKSVIIETAAKMRAGEAGEFSPTQLRSAVQNVDRSLRNKQFLRGEAQLQDIAEASRKVLPGVTPDSGTAGREAVVTGNVGLLSKILSPAFAAGSTESGQALMQWALLNRPEFARQLGAALRSERAANLGRVSGTVLGAQMEP